MYLLSNILSPLLPLSRCDTQPTRKGKSIKMNKRFALKCRANLFLRYWELESIIYFFCLG